MYDFKKIKMVIWDLDETFWNGVLSEGEIIPCDDAIALVKRLTDIGVVNSICSKNDFEPVKAKLESLGLWEYFVFPSVNWTPKGDRVAGIISDAQLRDENTLFLDDNLSNLNEAIFTCPRIMTAGPEVLSELLNEAVASDKLDLEHKRLKQYKILEEKRENKQTFSSNEEFLFNSNIKLFFGTDCEENIGRIHDLVWRSNQLNFTKLRSTPDELTELFADTSVNCGHVSVSDRFGDYGLVGFYAVRNDELIHFCFSCRTLGMGIEQYVYNHLSRPKLTVVGEVISDLSSETLPAWINQNIESHNSLSTVASVSNNSRRVLIKGPCDLFQILPYIADHSMIDTEFTYVAENGTTIESTGHTTHIAEAMRLTDEQKKVVIDDTGFFDIGIYNNNIYKNNYSVAVISILADANLGVYRHKKTGARLAFLEGYHPLTDRSNWDAYINGEYNSNSVKFTREMLESFDEKFEFVGINNADAIVDNLRYIKSHLPDGTTLAVMLGGELQYEKNEFPAYENRHLVHKEINDAIRAVADEIGLELIDVNKYLVDQTSFYDHFNHYIKPVYYSLAGDIVEIINKHGNIELKETGKSKMIVIRMKEFLAPYYYKMRSIFGGR